MERYVKELSTGKILISMELDSLPTANAEAFVTSRGLNLADYEIGEKTSDELDVLRLAARTPLEVWEQDMRATDSTPRWFEDYVTENSVTLAPGRAKDSYDAKVALRAGRPV